MCQANKPSSQKAAGLLQPLQIPSGKWESVSVDLITALPETPRGNTAIIVFVDRLTKMTHLVPCKTAISSAEYADVFLREVFAKDGCPKDIVSDRDPRFTSDFFRDVCRQLQIKQNMSTAFHPQTDGQTERMNRTVEDMLRAYVHPSQMDWDLLLPCCEFAINNAYQDSIKTTPFYLNHGEHPRTPATVAISGDSSPIFVANMHEALEAAQACLHEAQLRMASRTNEHRRHVVYNVGDFAWLNAKHFRQKFGGSKKLLHRFYGPFKVLRRIGDNACELELPPSMQVHDVINVSLLKPYVRGEGEVNHIAPPALLPDGSVQDEVESIIEHQGTGKNRQFLLKWSDSAMPTWHDESDLKNCKRLVKEYFARLKTHLPSRVQRPMKQVQDQKTSKSPVLPAEQADGSLRRSSRLRQSVQSVLHLFQ